MTNEQTLIAVLLITLFVVVAAFVLIPRWRSKGVMAKKMTETLGQRLGATVKSNMGAIDSYLFVMPEQAQTQLRELPLSKLRTFFTARIGFHLHDAAALKWLAEDIQENGLLQRIVVRPIAGSDEYEVIAGHNRVEAVRLNGEATIPAEVVLLDDGAATKLAIASNIPWRTCWMPSERASERASMGLSHLFGGGKETKNTGC